MSRLSYALRAVDPALEEKVISSSTAVSQSEPSSASARLNVSCAESAASNCMVQLLDIGLRRNISVASVAKRLSSVANKENELMFIL